MLCFLRKAAGLKYKQTEIEFGNLLSTHRYMLPKSLNCYVLNFSKNLPKSQCTSYKCFEPLVFLTNMT